MGDRAMRGLGRRQFLIGTALSSVALASGPMAWSQQSVAAAMEPQTLSGSDIYLTISNESMPKSQISEIIFFTDLKYFFSGNV